MIRYSRHEEFGVRALSRGQTRETSRGGMFVFGRLRRLLVAITGLLSVRRLLLAVVLPIVVGFLSSSPSTAASFAGNQFEASSGSTVPLGHDYDARPHSPGVGGSSLARAVAGGGLSAPLFGVEWGGTRYAARTAAADSTALVPYDADFAAQQILGRASNVTVGGRTLTVHGAERIMYGAPGRAPLGADTGMSTIDQILDTGTSVKYDPLRAGGPTIRVMAPDGSYVVVDATTGTRVVTVMVPR